MVTTGTRRSAHWHKTRTKQHVPKKDGDILPQDARPFKRALRLIAQYRASATLLRQFNKTAGPDQEINGVRHFSLVTAFSAFIA
jgi:hypothetical protein